MAAIALSPSLSLGKEPETRKFNKGFINIINGICWIDATKKLEFVYSS
jgi:hypothetical protein